jgi:hypothetical protein
LGQHFDLLAMTDDSYEHRRGLSFAQAEGLEPLPAQLKRTEVPKKLAALVWAALHREITAHVGTSKLTGLKLVKDQPWGRIFKDFFLLREHGAVDELTSASIWDYIFVNIKPIVLYSSNYATFYELLQFILRHEQCPPRFADEIDSCLRLAGAPFRLVNRDTFVPVASPEEAAAVERAFTDTSAKGLAGANSHLRSAAEALTARQYTDSIRESIHAVESTARTLAPSGSLSDALAILEKSIAIHGGLKKGFNSIYGYTSDEKGIRHPLLEKDAANVDETDALFMFSTCAAFISYLVGKARSAGLIK